MKAKKIVLNLILVICIIAFIISGYMLYKTYSEYKKGDNSYESIFKEVVQVNEEEKEDPTARTIDFDKLKQINKDAVGWIYLPNSVIDYPVVKGQDNAKYLDTLVTGEHNAAGSIFMDYRNSEDLTDDNTILYGHHMKNGSMFKKLVEYAKQDFYNNNKNLYYYTPTAIYELQVFSAYIVPATDNYTITNMGSEKEAMLNKFISRSQIKTDVNISSQDNILTMSTCTYEYDDARFVVHCKIVEKKSLQ